jgi:RNA polymerase sigma-70 factor (ECF subfamily)
MSTSSMKRPDPEHLSSTASTPEGGVPAVPTASRGPEAAASESQEEEHDLIRRAQDGESDAFEALVRRHEKRAWRIARNLVPGDEDARDLAQEAFLRVFRNLDRFDFQHPFATWLNRIVTNLAIDHLRKRRLTFSTSGVGDDDDERELELVDEGQEDPSRRMELGETAVLVRACIDSLAPHFQTVLTLRELEGLPCTEIARIVGATHVTVRWRLHRGRKLFQEEWERRERLAAKSANTGTTSPVDTLDGDSPS